MRPHQIAGCVAVFTLFLVAETSANAQGNFQGNGQGTEQQRQACTPDVFRLCGAYIPDSDRITACLRASGPRLSKPCYDVFFPAPPVEYSSPQDDPRRRYQRPQRAPYRDPYYDDDDN
jgi:hypothetical protein